MDCEIGTWNIDGKKSYRGMQPTCAGFGNGKLQKEIRRSGGRRLGGHGPKTGRRAIEDEEQQQQQDKSRKSGNPKRR
jgi:hypothetical protein